MSAFEADRFNHSRTSPRQQSYPQKLSAISRQLSARATPRCARQYALREVANDQRLMTND
jgi:hypothetical protein